MPSLSVPRYEFDVNILLGQAKGGIGLPVPAGIPRSRPRPDVEAQQNDAGKGQDLGGRKVPSGTQRRAAAKGAKGYGIVLLAGTSRRRGVLDEALVVEVLHVFSPGLFGAVLDVAWDQESAAPRGTMSERGVNQNISTTYFFKRYLPPSR
jgi:hypothetical protein